VYALDVFVTVLPVRTEFAVFARIAMNAFVVVTSCVVFWFVVFSFVVFWLVVFWFVVS